MTVFLPEDLLERKMQILIIPSLRKLSALISRAGMELKELTLPHWSNCVIFPSKQLWMKDRKMILKVELSFIRGQSLTENLLLKPQRMLTKMEDSPIYP
ncbi:Uncharacterised protein [Mycobacterium tuberculosis]|nr:Uncharacterised protein [Mycobacterium tuberculosis]